MRRRVAITGMGLISPLGNTITDTWRALLDGTSGVGRGSFFSGSASIPVQYAGKVKGFDPRTYGIKPKSLKVMNATIQYALAAASLALQDARVSKSDYRPEGAGIMLGVDGIQYSAEEFLLASYEAVGNDMARYISNAGGSNPIHTINPDMAVHPLWPLSVLANMALCHIAIEHDFQGQNLAFSSLDAGGSQAIGEAFRAVRDGVADMYLAGGSYGLNTLHLLSFSSLGLLARDRADCRPYDPSSRGCLLGEGAAILLIEELSRARKRGAPIYAEIAGYSSWFGQSRPVIWGDSAEAPAHDMTDCIAHACGDAGITAAEIDCIHTGGCGIPARDNQEISALSALFGGSATPVTSSAALTGTMLAAGGAFTAATAALSVHERTLVPAHGCFPAVSAGLTWSRKPEKKEIRYALANTFGITGEHTALVLQTHSTTGQKAGAPC